MCYQYSSSEGIWIELMSARKASETSPLILQIRLCKANKFSFGFIIERKVNIKSQVELSVAVPVS